MLCVFLSPIISPLQPALVCVYPVSRFLICVPLWLGCLLLADCSWQIGLNFNCVCACVCKCVCVNVYVWKRESEHRNKLKLLFIIFNSLLCHFSLILLARWRFLAWLFVLWRLHFIVSSLEVCFLGLCAGSLCLVQRTSAAQQGARGMTQFNFALSRFTHAERLVSSAPPPRGGPVLLFDFTLSCGNNWAVNGLRMVFNSLALLAVK